MKVFITVITINLLMLFAAHTAQAEAFTIDYVDWDAKEYMEVNVTVKIHNVSKITCRAFDRNNKMIGSGYRLFLRDHIGWDHLFINLRKQNPQSIDCQYEMYSN